MSYVPLYIMLMVIVTYVVIVDLTSLYVKTKNMCY